MILFRKPKPRHLTREEKVASAASYLARYAAQVRREKRRAAIREHLLRLTASKPSPIAPREVVVAGVRDRRDAR